MKAAKAMAVPQVEAKAAPTGVFRLFFEEARKQGGGSAVKSVAVSQVGRQRVEAESVRLQTVRSAVVEKATQLVEQRAANEVVVEERVALQVTELIREDLMAAFADEKVIGVMPEAPVARVELSPPPIRSGVGAQGAPAVAYSAQERTQQAMALIERIEVFVKSGRPALALTLNNSLGARVEIERLGHREIALKLISERGLPTPETLSTLREELKARGLKVAALSVA